MCGNCNAAEWFCFGRILAFLAAVTITLAVTDVILTQEFYCVNGGEWTYCSQTNNKEPYWPVWVASGIWGSVPVFLTGLVAICAGTDQGKTRWLSFLILVSALVFTPAIIILNAVEIWIGGSAKYSLYSLSNGVQEGTITPPTNPYEAKFALPVVVAVLGGIMHVMTFWVAICMCCCAHTSGIRLPATTTVVQQPQVIIQQQPYQCPPPRMVAPPCDPCSRYPSLPYLPTRYNPSVYNFFPSSSPKSFYGYR